MIGGLLSRLGRELRAGTGADFPPLLSADEIADLARLATQCRPPLRFRDIHDHHAGDWPSTVLGRGLDFEESRPYSPGDDIRDMDWRTTARLGHPYLKTYREERRPVLHLVLDRGPGMRFGTRRRLKLAQAARLATLHIFAAVEANLAVSASLWDRSDRVLAPVHGRAGALELISAAIAPAAPEARDDAEWLRARDRLERLAEELPLRTRLVLLSDFGWLTQAHAAVLARLAERCEVLALRLFDPAEHALPDVGLARFHDLGRGATVWLDTGRAATREAQQAAFARRQAEIGALLERAGVRQIEVSSAEDDLIGVLDHHG